MRSWPRWISAGSRSQWCERTTTRTSSGCRVPISGSSKRSVRPPRVTDSTMSRSERESEPDLAGGHGALVQVQTLAAGDEVLDDGDHARGVGREAQQPAGGGRRGDDGVGAGLPEEVGVLLLADTGRDRHARVELPHGEGDEDGGVVPVGRDDDRAGPLDRGPAQHLGAAGVADDAGEAERVGLVDGPRLGVDDDDLVQRRAEGLQRADGAAALGAVAAHDDVLAHAGPPATDAELLPRARGERLEGRSDEDEQEHDAQRRDEQDVDQPGARGDRRDVAVAGGRERDGRVVEGVEQRQADVVAVPVAVPVEVDDPDGEQQEDEADDDPAPRPGGPGTAPRGRAGHRCARSPGLPAPLSTPRTSSEPVPRGARRRTRSGQPTGAALRRVSRRPSRAPGRPARA